MSLFLFFPCIHFSIHPPANMYTQDCKYRYILLYYSYVSMYIFVFFASTFPVPPLIYAPVHGLHGARGRVYTIFSLTSQFFLLVCWSTPGRRTLYPGAARAACPEDWWPSGTLWREESITNMMMKAEVAQKLKLLSHLIVSIFILSLTKVSVLS